MVHGAMLVLSVCGGGGEKKILNETLGGECCSISVLLHYIILSEKVMQWVVNSGIGALEKYKQKMERWREGSKEVKM